MKLMNAKRATSIVNTLCPNQCSCEHCAPLDEDPNGMSLTEKLTEIQESSIDWDSWPYDFVPDGYLYW